MRTIFRHILMGAMALGVALAGIVTAALAAFPEKPITIIVYVKPGGGVDVDSRKLAAIGERLTGAKFVVRNKTGAGGLVWAVILTSPYPKAGRLAPSPWHRPPPAAA